MAVERGNSGTIHFGAVKCESTERGERRQRDKWDGMNERKVPRRLKGAQRNSRSSTFLHVPPTLPFVK